MSPGMGRGAGRYAAFLILWERLPGPGCPRAGLAGELAGRPDTQCAIVRLWDHQLRAGVGLGVRLPRWSLAYLGVGLYWGNYYSHGRFYGVTYGYQGWLPLLAGLAVGLLLSRSFRPVLRLIGSIWRDWTRLSFGMYAYVLPVMTVIFFDSDWGKLEFYGLIFDTLLVAAGAAVYLRSQTIWIKAVSLQGVMILMAIRGFFMGGWFGGAENLASINLFALLTIPLFWGGLLFIPGLLGLLRRGLGLLNTQGRT